MENAANGTAAVAPEGETVSKSEEVTKRSIRVQVWKKFQEERCASHSSYIYNRITNFVDAEKAAALLADTQEFKNSKNIKINIDRSQKPIKLLAIAAGKPLFVSAARDSTALFARIDVPADTDLTLQKKMIQPQSVREYGKELDISTDVKLDMIIIGSVAVSRDGHRIGKGNGYVDLDFGILAHCGIITKDTIIVTTVHDIQVFDTLPENLFKSYDVPVDMIVTPTEVIRVTKRLQRPKGIEWNLLSERRLGIVPVLKLIKEQEEKAGQVITLKTEDTDVETNRKPRFGQNKRFNKRRRRYPRTTSENNGDHENTNSRPRRQRPRRIRRDRDDRDKTDRDNVENSSRNRRRGPDDKDICFKISNIAKNVRIKDLKQELRKRNCNPNFISWKVGRCYLHFGKPNTDIEIATNEMLKSLSDLKLTIQNGEKTEEIELQVEVMKRQQENRIETTDVTAV